MTFTEIDPVEFLVQLKYPAEIQLRLARKRAGLPYTPGLSQEELKLSGEIDKFRMGLKALPPDELHALFIEQRDMRAAELQEKARRDDEHRFFNHPNALANLGLIVVSATPAAPPQAPGRRSASAWGIFTHWLSGSGRHDDQGRQFQLLGDGRLLVP